MYQHAQTKRLHLIGFSRTLLKLRKVHLVVQNFLKNSPKFHLRQKGQVRPMDKLPKFSLGGGGAISFRSASI